jgi:hypothetical protein
MKLVLSIFENIQEEVTRILRTSQADRREPFRRTEQFCHFLDERKPNLDGSFGGAAIAKAHSQQQCSLMLSDQENCMDVLEQLKTSILREIPMAQSH